MVHQVLLFVTLLMVLLGMLYAQAQTPTNAPTALRPGQPTNPPTDSPTELLSTAAPSLMPRPSVQPTTFYSPSARPTRFAQTQVSGALIFLAIVLLLGFCAFFTGLLWYFCGPQKSVASDEIMRSDRISFITSRCILSYLKFLINLKLIPENSSGNRPPKLTCLISCL